MTDLKNKLQKKAENLPEKKVNPFFNFLDTQSAEIKKALPSHLTPERMIRVIKTAYTNNPKLQACTSSSLVGAMITSSQLGLEVNTPLGMAYILPYDRSFKDDSGKWQKVTEAQFQIGYQGLLELAYRSGKYKRISVEAVDEKDFFEFEFGLEQKLRHIPSKSPSGNSIYYYAIYETKDGGINFGVWSKEKILNHAKETSKSFTGKAWTNFFDSMAKKTVIKDLLKFAPKSVELYNTITSDATINNFANGEVEKTYDYDLTPINENDIEDVNGNKVDKATGEVLQGKEGLF